MRSLGIAFTWLAFGFAGSCLIDGITGRPIAVAAENPKVWNSSLEDLSGIWTSDAGHQIKLLFREDISAMSDALFETLIIPVAVDNGDVTYRSVVANLDVLEALRQIETVAKKSGTTVPEQLETMRRNWNRDRTSFTITQISAGGAVRQYGFVRELLPNEVTQLASVQERVDETLRKQAALIAKETQTTVASDARQKSMLQSPEVKAAAERIGVGQAFFAGSPAQQEQTLSDAKASVTQRVNDTRRELTQIENTRAVSDYDEEERQKRRKALLDRLAKWEPQLAAIDVVQSALGRAVAVQLPNSSTDWKQYVGRAPMDLINASPLGQALETRLGNRYQQFTRGLEKAEVVALLGGEFVVGSGCMLNGCGSNGSFIAINANTQDMIVVIAESGDAKILMGADFAVSQETATMFDKWQDRFNPHPARVLKLKTIR